MTRNRDELTSPRRVTISDRLENALSVLDVLPDVKREKRELAEFRSNLAEWFYNNSELIPSDEG